MIHEYFHLLHDVPHIMFEATWDLCVVALSYLPLKRWILRHDKEHHGGV